MISNAYRDQEIPWHVCEVRCGRGHLLGLRRVMLFDWSEDTLRNLKTVIVPDTCRGPRGVSHARHDRGAGCGE